MAKYIITISREFGCGAREIARGLASRLNIILHDKDLVDLTVMKGEVHTDKINEYDERSPKGPLWNEFAYGSSSVFYSQSAVETQAEIIREMAESSESCIFFGRCADYILMEYPDVISFFLYAPLEARIRHIHEAYTVSDKEAARMIKRIDKQRHNYYKYVTGKNRGDRSGKDIMINVDKYGVEKTIQLMYDAVRILFE